MAHESLTTREEVFAPVVALYCFKTEEEVLERANDCEVGLGSFIVTESMSRMWRVAEALEVGMVGVNQGLLSACESPFGGKYSFRGMCHYFADWYCYRSQGVWIWKRGRSARNRRISLREEHPHQHSSLIGFNTHEASEEMRLSTWVMLRLLLPR
jgi:hypothetical protein